MKTWFKRSALELSGLLKSGGQTVVEFVLLLVVITTISYTFVFFMNRNLARYWEYSVNLIIDDRPGTRTVTTER
jgi:hypothetical protein